MLNRYFNESEFNYVMKTFENDPFETKKRFDHYLNKYPKDYYARVYYVILLTRICMFKEADDEYNRILEEARNDSFYAYNAKKLSGFKYNLCIAKLKLLGSQEKYNEILILLQDHTNLFNTKDQNYISAFCRSKLGLISKNAINQNPDAYRFNQNLDYSEKTFRDHIQKHEADYNLDKSIPNEFIFNPNFPLDDIILEIKKYIPSNKKLFPGYFDDVYYFKYDNCGRINNTMANYFVVVCFHNTTNFVTMCPTNNCQKLPFVDLNYLKEKNTIIDKTDEHLSQIEKFNRRYNRS